jgi:hypothetical protein
MARTGSGGTDARIKGLLDEVAALSEELLVERKRSLELLRELNREKDVNKRPLMLRDGRNQPDGKRSRTELVESSDISASTRGEGVTIDLHRDDEGNTRREILQPSRKFPPPASQSTQPSQSSQPSSVPSIASGQSTQPSQSSQSRQSSQSSSASSSVASQQHLTVDGQGTHTLKYNRPAMSTYPLTILRTQMVNRTEENVDLSVGVWKEKLQQEWMYMPQATAWPWRPEKHEKSIRMLRGAMKAHGTQ